jgi:hypothetical protein
MPKLPTPSANNTALLGESKSKVASRISPIVNIIFSEGIALRRQWRNIEQKHALSSGPRQMPTQIMYDTKGERESERMRPTSNVSNSCPFFQVHILPDDGCYSLVGKVGQ